MFLRTIFLLSFFQLSLFGADFGVARTTYLVSGFFPVLIENKDKNRPDSLDMYTPACPYVIGRFDTVHEISELLKRGNSVFGSQTIQEAEEEAIKESIEEYRSVIANPRGLLLLCYESEPKESDSSGREVHDFILTELVRAQINKRLHGTIIADNQKVLDCLAANIKRYHTKKERDHGLSLQTALLCMQRQAMLSVDVVTYTMLNYEKNTRILSHLRYYAHAEKMLER